MNNETKNENRLEGKINIPRFPLNTTKFYTLDKSQDWVKDLLLELNEKADEFTTEEYLEKSSLVLELEVLKKFKQETGEFLLVKGKIKTQYFTQCVRTLANMEDGLSTEIQACFIDSLKKDDDIYADQTETFQENEMYDLYFHEKNFAPLAEMIHEIIFLNINQYPIKDADSELDWAKDTSDKKQ